MCSRKPVGALRLTGPEYFGALDAMCRKFPETTLALDHLGHVGFDRPILEADVASLCRLAMHKKVYVKVSGFWALGRRQPPYLDLLPVIRQVYRGLWAAAAAVGQRQPVPDDSPHRYHDSIDLVRNRLDFLSADDRQWLLRKTAERLFF